MVTRRAFSIRKTPGGFGLGRQLRNPTLNKRTHIPFHLNDLERNQAIGGGGVQIDYPPCYETVLSWFKGNTTSDVLLKDSAPALGDYPMQMFDGPALLPNGVDDTFTTSVNHGTIVSYEGTVTLSYDGATLTSDAGTFYNLLFSDDTLYPCIGKTDTANPTVVHATNGAAMQIVSADYAAIWAGTQQTLFHEFTQGYWEDANGRYPYAHAGATYNAPGWNHPQNSFAYKEDGVGNFSGTAKISITETVPESEDISLSFYIRYAPQADAQAFMYFLGNDPSFYVRDTGVSGSIYVYFKNTVGTVVTLRPPDNSLIVGVNKIDISKTGDNLTLSINDIAVDTDTLVGSLALSAGFNIGASSTGVASCLSDMWGVQLNGTLIKLNDGELYGENTTAIHDSNGNVVGALTTADVPSFWSKTEVPYAIQQMDVTEQVFTDATGAAKKLTQDEVLAGCNTNKQYYMGSIAPKPKELICHETVISDECDADTLVRVGKAEYVLDIDDGAFVLDIDDDEKVYSEVA